MSSCFVAPYYSLLSPSISHPAFFQVSPVVVSKLVDPQSTFTTRSHYFHCYWIFNTTTTTNNNNNSRSHHNHHSFSRFHFPSPSPCHPDLHPYPHPHPQPLLSVSTMDNEPLRDQDAQASIPSPTPSWADQASSSSTYLVGAQLGPIAHDSLFFVQLGFGIDQHGQDATKAAIRAVKDAISFNSIPSARRLIGLDKMRVHVRLAVPDKYRHNCDVHQVLKVLPYGRKSIEIVQGGLMTRSGIAVQEYGDIAGNEDIIVVCAAVEVGS